MHFILPWELTLLSNVQRENLLAFHYRSAEVLTRIFQGPFFFTDMKGKKVQLLNNSRCQIFWPAEMTGIYFLQAYRFKGKNNVIFNFGRRKRIPFKLSNGLKVDSLVDRGFDCAIPIFSFNSTIQHVLPKYGRYVARSSSCTHTKRIHSWLFAYYSGQYYNAIAIDPKNSTARSRLVKIAIK